MANKSEISSSAVLRARMRAARRGYAKSGFWIHEGRGRLPFPDNDLDLVIASHVLEHVPDDRRTLTECRRVGTRFDKLAINFVAMLKVAMIQRYLKFEFSDTA